VAGSRQYPPEQLVTIVPADVAAVLLARAGLEEYRIRHRGDSPRVDQVLIAMTTVAIRWREQLAGNGQTGAPDPETGPGWLTTRQAAERLGVSDRTVRHRIAAGELPARRFGHVHLIDPADVNHRRPA